MPIESTETSFKLQDRTVLLTGPCNSVNQAIAHKFTQMGANIVLVDRATDKAQRFAEQIMDAREINERYGRAMAVQADFSKPAQIQDAVSRSAEAFGGIDIYVDGLLTAEARKFRDGGTPDQLDHALDANLRAPLLMTHSVLRFLEGRKRGRVIYLIHDLARIGMPLNALTAASRTGLTAFARTLAREVAENSITVNCVAIGVTEELLLNQGVALTGTQTASLQDVQMKLLQMNSAAQMMETERIANMVAFIASPLSSGVTGQTIAVSQGLSFLS
jgi:3-oxoacyl-[acyl-carrier protein] reductase